MDRLRSCMGALRSLAKQPGDNRQREAEQRITEYLQTETTTLRFSLERLRDAISAEGKDPFWIMMRDHVQSRLSKLVAEMVTSLRAPGARKGHQPGGSTDAL